MMNKNWEKKQQIEEQTNDILLTVGKACIYFWIARKIYKPIEEKIIDEAIKRIK